MPECKGGVRGGGVAQVTQVTLARTLQCGASSRLSPASHAKATATASELGVKKTPVSSKVSLVAAG